MAEHIQLKGTFYEVGKALGILKKSNVQAIVNNLTESDIYRKLKAFIATSDGATIYRKLNATCRQFRFDYLTELQGVADGAEVSYDDMFVMNVKELCAVAAILPDLFILNVPELCAVAGILPDASHGVTYCSMFQGCTNVSLETADGQFYLVHTEDIDPFFQGKDLMLSVEIVDEKGELVEKWTEYNIPGVVPGSSLGFNCHGVMFAHNNIYPKDFNKIGIPRRFMCRGLMTVRDPSESKTIFSQHPGIASACTLTYLKYNSGAETSGPPCTVLETVGVDDHGEVVAYHPHGLYYHTNILQHLPRECHPEESSVHRAAVVSQYINKDQVRTLDHLLKVVSDDRDPVFPVYRNGKAPDYLATGATGLFDLKAGILTIYMGKPSCSQPNHVFKVGQ